MKTHSLQDSLLSISGKGFLPAVTGVRTPARPVRFTVNPAAGTISAQVVR
jgi:hypothetical protein